LEKMVKTRKRSVGLLHMIVNKR